MCIGGYLPCLAKEGAREQGGGKPRQELAGWRAEGKEAEGRAGKGGHWVSKVAGPFIPNSERRPRRAPRNQV